METLKEQLEEMSEDKEVYQDLYEQVKEEFNLEVKENLKLKARLDYLEREVFYAFRLFMENAVLVNALPEEEVEKFNIVKTMIFTWLNENEALAQRVENRMRIEK